MQGIKETNMKKENFNHILKMAAFVFPFYFVFYVPPDESLVKVFSRYTIAGFCFYALVAVIVIVIKTAG